MKKSLNKTVRFAVTVALLFSMVTGAIPVFCSHEAVAMADTTKSYQDEIDAAKKKKEQMEQQYNELGAMIADLKSQEAEIEAYINSLDEKMQSLYEDIEQLETDIATCEQKLRETTLALETARQKEADQYQTMKHRIQYMYENGETGILEVLVGEGSLSALFNNMEYRKEITKYDKQLLERYNRTKLEVANTEVLLEAQLEEMNSLKVMQEAELAAVIELADAKAQELATLAESIGADEEMLFLYWEEIIEQGTSIEELEKLEAERIAEEERKRKEEEERIRKIEEMKKNQSIDNMLWPLPASGRITSKFGYRKSPTAGASTYHRGIDIGAPTGTPVIAAIAGTVIKSGYGSSTGYHIVIDHGNGVQTKYYHASKLLVKKGEYVERGQVIMKVGSTGVSTGPHLHFGLFINDVAVDPLKYVSFSDNE